MRDAWVICCQKGCTATKCAKGESTTNVLAQRGEIGVQGIFPLQALGMLATSRPGRR